MRGLSRIALLVTAAILATPAIAGPGQWSTKIVYYSDYTKTVVVGQEWDTCPTIDNESQTIVVGTQTEYYDVYSGNCP